MGPVKENGEYTNHKLYTCVEKIRTQFRKEILPSIVTRHNEAKDFDQLGVWFTEVERELQEGGITCHDIQECDSLEKELGTHHGSSLYPGKTWNEERKEAHLQQMQEYWPKVKAEEENC